MFQDIESPNKEQLVEILARAVNAPFVPLTSKGSSTGIDLINFLASQIPDKQEKQMSNCSAVEKVLTYFGLSYDSKWDDSSGRNSGGGGTITARTFSKLLTAIRSTPRRFILLELASEIRKQPMEIEFHGTKSAPLIVAGPQSLEYLRSKDGGFYEHTVEEVRANPENDSVWQGPWIIRLSERDSVEGRDLLRFLQRVSGLGKKTVEFTAGDPHSHEVPSSNLPKTVVDFWSDLVTKDIEKRSIEINYRPHQQKLRKAMLTNWNSSCIISDVSTTEVLDAAHILPISELQVLRGETSTIDEMLTEVIPLRADLHRLWDKHCLAIEIETMTVRLFTELRDLESYKELDGKPIDLSHVPKSAQPNEELLKTHYSHALNYSPIPATRSPARSVSPHGVNNH